MAKGVKTGGRKPGTPNRTTQAAKDAIAMVAHDLGGAARMGEWVREDPLNERIFWKDIYTKLLPLQLSGELTVRTLAQELAELNANRSAEGNPSVA